MGWDAGSHFSNKRVLGKKKNRCATQLLCYYHGSLFDMFFGSTPTGPLQPGSQAG